jgi:hypothetical protein
VRLVRLSSAHGRVAQARAGGAAAAVATAANRWHLPTGREPAAQAEHQESWSQHNREAGWTRYARFTTKFTKLM